MLPPQLERAFFQGLCAHCVQPGCWLLSRNAILQLKMVRVQRLAVLARLLIESSSGVSNRNLCTQDTDTAAVSLRPEAALQVVAQSQCTNLGDCKHPLGPTVMVFVAFLQMANTANGKTVSMGLCLTGPFQCLLCLRCNLRLGFRPMLGHCSSQCRCSL